MAKKRTTKAERETRNAEIDAAIEYARELVRRGFAELREKRGYDGLTPQFRAVIERSTRPAER